MNVRLVATDCIDAGPSESWHLPDLVTAIKLEASVRRLGQLRLPVVRQDGSRYTLVEGRAVLAALRASRQEQAWVVVLAPSAPDDDVVRLGLEISFELDYAAVAWSLSRLVAAGHSPDTLSIMGPFDTRRVTQMDALTRFDWSRFDEETGGQSSVDWDASGETLAAEHVIQPVPVPAAETVALVSQALAHDTPEAVVEAVREAVAAKPKSKRRPAPTPSLFGDDEE